MYTIFKHLNHDVHQFCADKGWQYASEEHPLYTVVYTVVFLEQSANWFWDSCELSRFLNITVLPTPVFTDHFWTASTGNCVFNIASIKNDCMTFLLNSIMHFEIISMLVGFKKKCIGFESSRFEPLAQFFYSHSHLTPLHWLYLSAILNYTICTVFPFIFSLLLNIELCILHSYYAYTVWPKVSGHLTNHSCVFVEHPIPIVVTHLQT